MGSMLKQNPFTKIITFIYIRSRFICWCCIKIYRFIAIFLYIKKFKIRISFRDAYLKFYNKRNARSLIGFNGKGFFFFFKPKRVEYHINKFEIEYLISCV